VAGPLIGAGASLLGGSLFKPKMSAEEKQALAAQQQLQQTQTDALKRGMGLAESYAPQAQGFLTSGQQAFQAPTDYWSRILSGDQQEINRVIAPEANRISGAYGQAARQASMFLPRGGYASTKLAELPFQRASDIGNLANTLRPQAAQNLGNLAGAQSSIGSGLLGNILSVFGQAGQGAGQTGNSILNYGLANRGQQFGQGQAIGGSLGALFQKIGPLLKPGNKTAGRGNIADSMFGGSTSE
jgi:hypothetical protein